MENTFLSRFLETLALAAIPVLVPFICALLIAQIRKVWESAQNWKPDLAEVLSDAVSMAVTAAQQAGIAGFIQDKKSYAIDVAQKYLKAHGLNVDLILISAAIESAVHDANLNGQLIEKLPVTETPTTIIAGK
jgi:hypothetical protein